MPRMSADNIKDNTQGKHWPLQLLVRQKAQVTDGKRDVWQQKDTEKHCRKNLQKILGNPIPKDHGTLYSAHLGVSVSDA